MGASADVFGWLRSLVGLGRGATAERSLPLRARYDNSLTTPENQRTWWGADWMSAKAANNYQVRRQLRVRSRYELSNNPYLWGIANGNADDFVGPGGPTLQVKTGNAEYNRAVEESWNQWCAEVDLPEKIRTMKLARTVDGEGFLILKTVNELDHEVKLFPVDVEADQVTTPAPKDLGELWVDGLTLHPITGRPTHYHVLKHHPGDYYFPDFNPLAVEKLPAEYVIHWFPKFRPGQVRGVPVFTPSLDLFAELRAFRRATLGAAEMAADYAVLLEQDKETGAYNPDEDTDATYEPFKNVPLLRKMLTTLPPGGKATQLTPQHPGTTYEMFSTLCLGEAVRPLAYPLNLALGTSQRFNFSSAKLDHINYRNSITVERSHCETAALNRLFRAWYSEAVLAGAIPLGNGPWKLPPVEWHWPGFESIDPLVDVQASAQALSSGQDSWRDFWARRGRDWQDVFRQLNEERLALEKLGLSFGDVVKRSITQTENTDAQDEVPANAA
jgi:lambda family phage portal protein